MDIRVLRPSDIPHVQTANITNLPENYFCKYYLYHALSWPQLSYVAVDVSHESPLANALASHYFSLPLSRLLFSLEARFSILFRSMISFPIKGILCNIQEHISSPFLEIFPYF